MFNDFRFSRMGVVSQALGISALVAILFVTARDGNNSAAFHTK